MKTVSSLTLAIALGVAATAHAGSHGAGLTEVERNEIMTIAPDANLDNLTAAQVEELRLIANQAGTERDPATQDRIDAILATEGATPETAPLTEVERASILDLAPDANLDNLTAAQVEELRLIANQADTDRDPATQERVDAILAEAATAQHGTMQDAAPLTEVERASVLGIVPDANLDNLTAAQVEELRSVLPGADRDPAARARIESIVGG